MRGTRHLLGAAVLLAAVTSVRADPAPSPSPAPGTRTIILLRHGQYDTHDPVAADGTPGPGLTPLGVAQARLAAARLATLGPIDAVYASPLTRARETARVVGEDLHRPVEVMESLAECTPPTWRESAVKDEKPADMAACVATLDRVFAERFRPAPGVADRREVLVCHGNVIRYLVTKALRVDTKAWLEMSIGHASLTTIRVQPDGTFRVIAVGDVGHLPPNLQTGSSADGERSLAVPAP